MSEQHCAIPACEWEDDTSNEGDAKLVPSCNGGHLIHVGCLKRLFVASRTPCCPLCRDGFLGILADLARDNPHVPTADPHTEIGSIDLDAILWDPPGDDSDSLTGNTFGDIALFGLLANVVHRNVQGPPTGATLPPSPFFRAIGPPHHSMRRYL